MSEVKIVFELEADAWHGSSTESLWATPVGYGSFKLLNSPFYVFNVSFQDFVFADTG